MLKIKNSQAYRTFFKEVLKGLKTDKIDEHLLGPYQVDAEGNRSTGWFELFYGDAVGNGNPREGVRNKLLAFLNMAKDSQAVYEFLQNASDAGSSHFTMIWGADEVDGQDYLLVANNGKMFDVDNVRSILNVGASTKSSDQQSIGKFGIGFKLAHRLVGKDNGINELLTDFSGPILFSWKNNEIGQLAATATVEPTDNSFTSSDVEGNAPWLFKILLTCFPCLPENESVQEYPKLFDGAQTETPLFPKSELQVMSRWSRKLLDSEHGASYKEGSMFFMRLGNGKSGQLQDNNLREGVQFSMGVLAETNQAQEKGKGQELHTVQLNDGEPITMPDLQYHLITIDEEDSDHCKIYDQETDSDEQIKNIELLWGFKPYEEIGDFFKGAPNFYLYFPLSEEVNQLNFILHSNAFDNSSSRTFLQHGSEDEPGVNEKLFKVLVERMETQMDRWAVEVPKRFLDFYAAVLSSGRSINDSRSWIVEPLLEPLEAILKRKIPVRKTFRNEVLELLSSEQHAYIKSTQIEIDLEGWGMSDIRWFYWDQKTYPRFAEKATIKLGLSHYTIYKLLERKGISEHINTWLNNETEKIGQVLSELSTAMTSKTDHVVNNLKDLKILEFNDGQVLSFRDVDERQSEGYFVMHNTLSKVSGLLNKLGFKTTTRDIGSYSFFTTYRSNLGGTAQFGDYKELVKLFSSLVTTEVAEKLTPEEKHQIYQAFYDLNDDKRTQRMAELKLFRNKAGNIECLKNMLRTSGRTYLQPYVIDPLELPAKLSYLVGEEKDDVYDAIIIPFWEDLCDRIARDPESGPNTLKHIVELHENSNNKSTLGHHCLWFFQKAAKKIDGIYFHESLTGIVAEDYVQLQHLLLEHFGIFIPDQWSIPFLEEEPFNRESSALSLKDVSIELSEEDVKLLLDFSASCEVDFYRHLYIQQTDGKYRIEPAEGVQNCISENQKLLSYIVQYHSDEYVPLPLELQHSKQKPEANGEELAAMIINDFSVESSDENQMALLTAALVEEGKEMQQRWLQKLPDIELDVEWGAETQNLVYLKLLANLLDYDGESEKTSLSDKLILISDDERIALKDIPHATDSLLLKRGDKEYKLLLSKVLNRDDQMQMGVIQEFANRCVQEGELNAAQTEALFKLGEAAEPAISDFNNALEDGQLLNAHQLAFVLFSTHFESATTCKYKVYAKSEQWYDLEGNWLLTDAGNLEIFEPDYVFHKQYNGLRETLRLHDVERLEYHNSENNLILSRFRFQVGCTPEILQQAASNTEVLNYLLSCWKQDGSTRISMSELDWSKVLSFDPKNHVHSSLQMPTEKLPDDVVLWLANDADKISLLQAIGVHTETSAIVNLRMHVLNAEEEAVEPSIESLSDDLIEKTLLGLATGFVGDTGSQFPIKFSEDDPRIPVIEKMMLSLTKSNVPDFPLLVHRPDNEMIVLDPNESKVYQLPEVIREGLLNENSLALETLYETVNMAVHTKVEELQSWFESAYNMLPLVQEFEEGNSVEHREPFYKDWSETNHLSLHRAERLIFKVTATLGTGDLFLGNMKASSNWVLNDSETGTPELHYGKLLSIDALIEELDNTTARYSAALQIFIEKHRKMMEAFIAYGSGNDTINQMVQKYAVEQERKDHLLVLDEEVKYSHNWFIAFLEFLDTFSEVDTSTGLKTLNFESAERHDVALNPNRNHFYLKDAGEIIPETIEHFEDFELTLYYSDKTVARLSIESATKKGQDLLVFTRERQGHQFLKTLDKVQRAVITFKPVLDLIKRLKNAFKNQQNIEPWGEISDAIPPIHFIYGPPGTGKTTRLQKEICDELKADPNKRFLVLTPTNKAADVLVKKVRNENEKLYLTRVGMVTDPELDVPEMYQTSITHDLLENCQLLASTIHRLPYSTIEGDVSTTFFNIENHWDSIIFDEASMIDLPYMVFALRVLYASNPNAKFIVAGDPKQIPPVPAVNDKDLEDMQIVDENIYKMLGVDSFDDQKQQQILEGTKHTIENLRIQYRSLKPIGELYSHYAYEGLLEHNRIGEKSAPKPLPEQYRKNFQNSVSFIPFPVNREDSLFEPKKLLYSSYHMYAALLAVEMIRHFDMCARDDQKNHWSIGVVCPYKAQAVLIDKLIRSYQLSEFTNVYCDTVHGFQGDECDIVLFTANPNSLRYTGHKKSLLSKNYIYNVAISRARDYLWILYPDYIDSKNPNISRLMEINKEGEDAIDIIPANVLEGHLFKRSDFIQTHNHFSGHDPINVYAQTQQNYFIKASPSAIDILLKEVEERWD